VEIYGGSPNFRNAYVYLYSSMLSIACLGRLIASAGYRERRPQTDSLGKPEFLASAKSGIRAVFIPTSDVNSNYNSLNLRLRRQFDRGLLFDFYYRL